VAKVEYKCKKLGISRGDSCELLIEGDPKVYAVGIKKVKFFCKQDENYFIEGLVDASILGAIYDNARKTFVYQKGLILK
jgi:hypothetical protein